LPARLRKREEEERGNIMKKLFLVIGMLFVFTPFAWTAIADDTTPATPAASEAKPAGLSVDDLKKLLGLSIYVQGGYNYNFENPASRENDLRVFDQQENSFLLDMAQILFNKDPQLGEIGYRFKLTAGETAKYIHSAGLGGDNDEFDLTEAYIDYMAPLGKGLKLEFGKFATPAGAEVIEAKDDFNYSRSFLFNYAVPFTHTGLMAGYTFSDVVAVNVYAVNGWDDAVDNNNGKTGILSINLTPIEEIGLLFNFMYGPEENNDNSDNRLLFDWVGTFKATKSLTLVVNTDYATEEHAAAGNGTAEWYGVAGYVKYDFCDYFSATVRGEYFDDKNGVRTTVDGVSGIPQELKEITFTPEFKIAKGLILRPEYRHDWSSKNAFDLGKKDSQDTVALGLMYAW
jgi:hypothetical protein